MENKESTDFSIFGRQVSSCLLLFHDYSDILQTVSVHELEDNVLFPNDICEDQACLTDITYEGPKTDAGIHLDALDLPVNFVPKSKPTNVYLRIREKQKKEHEETINNMKLCMVEINAKVEDEIRTQASYIADYLKNIQEHCEKCINLHNITEENAFHVKEETFNRICLAISKFNESRNKKVNLFAKFLIELERYRIGIFKELLVAAYKQTTEINYLLPYKLKESFEYEILKLNQVTLNNFYHISELQERLNLQNNDEVRNWLHRVDKQKRDWIINFHLKNVRLNSLVEEIPEPIVHKKLRERKLCTIVDQIYETVVAGVNPKEVFKFIECTQDNVDRINYELNTLICILKVLNTSIFYRFLPELQEITVQMTILRTINAEMKEETGCIIDPKYYVEIFFKHELRQIQLLWNKYLDEIEADIKEAEKFVESVVVLWDKHFIRLKDIKECIQTDTENLIIKNSIQADAAEIKFTMAVDQLRQESNERNLKKSFDKANKVLNSLDVMYTQHEKAAIKTEEKYLDYLKTEIPIIMAEVKRFLNTFVIDPYFDPKSQRERASRTNLIVNPMENMVPNNIFYCTYQAQLLKNWMFGIWDALDNYLDTCEKEIFDEGELYVEGKCKLIRDASEIKRGFNKTRYERLYHSIYMRRLEELTKHSQRLEQHEQGVEEKIQGLKNEMSSVSDQLKNLVASCNDDLKNKVESLRKLSNTKLIMLYLKFMRQANVKFMDDVTKITDSFQFHCEIFMKKVKYSNMKFIEAIRTFSEEGNYAVDEVKSVMKRLKKIEKKAVKATVALTKELKKQEAKTYDQINKMIEETETQNALCLDVFQHNENSVKVIENLQKSICQEVHDYKSQLQTNKNQLKELEDIFKSSLEDTESMDKIFEELSKTKMQLMHPKPVKPIKHLKMCDSEGAADTTKEENVDFTQYLFDQVPKMEPNYLAQLNVKMYNSFREIQDSANEFYKSDKEIIKELPSNTIQPTYDDFMREVTSKFKCYQIQYEINWMENAHDFVKLVQSLDDVVQAGNEKYMDDCEKDSTSQLQDEYGKAKSQLSFTIDQLEDRYMGIHNKLKTLHGHPKNKSLLKNLNKEMEDVLADDKETLLLTLHERENVTKLLEDTSERVKEQIKVYKSIDEKLDVIRLFADEIREQLITKIKLTKNEIETSKVENMDGLKTRFEQMLVKTGISNESITDIIENEYKSVRKQNDWDGFYKKLNNKLTNVDNENSEILNYFKNLESQTHTKFQNMWKSDVAKICSLYSVKYNF